jgi:hypothetical protein
MGGCGRWLGLAIDLDAEAVMPFLDPFLLVIGSHLEVRNTGKLAGWGVGGTMLNGRASKVAVSMNGWMWQVAGPRHRS